MSKYIRTYDGNVFEKHTFIINDVKYIGYGEGFKLYNESEIIKEADTVDELLDCIVFTEKSVYNGQERKYIMYKPFVIEEDNMFETTIDAKGAIWTDKGLIYVAKMKGILPNGEIDWKLV